jgi:tetratricopeptide (TPR) repeat protein
MGNTSLCTKSLAAAGLAIVLLAPMHVDADQSSERVVALLPPYCKYVGFIRDSVQGGNDPSQIERWKSTIGEGMFSHMHHYCFGLIHRNAAKSARTKLERVQELQASLPEFDYVIKNSQPDFVLLPEILTMKGESLIGLGRANLAMIELQRAITLKPDYWPPYVAISDYYKDAGEPAKAREWLEKGLSFSPNTKALQNRLAEINGMKGKRKAAPQLTGEPAAPEPTVAKPTVEKTGPRPETKSEAPGER